MATYTLRNNYLLNLTHTFIVNFGFPYTGKTVQANVLDNTGAQVSSGITIGSVVELGDGHYGVTILFSTVFNGYVKLNNVSDGIINYVPFTVVDSGLVLAGKKILISRIMDLSFIEISSFDD